MAKAAHEYTEDDDNKEEHGKVDEACEQEDQHTGGGVDQRPTANRPSSSSSTSTATSGSTQSQTTTDSSSTSSTSYPATSASTTPSVKQFLFGNREQIYLAGVFLLRLSMLICFTCGIIGFIYPILPQYRLYLFVSSFLVNLICLVHDHQAGFSATSHLPLTQRLAPVVLDPRSFRMLTALAFTYSSGNLIQQLLLFHCEIGHIGEYAYHFGSRIHPVVTNQVKDRIIFSKYFSMLMGMEPMQWKSKTTQSRWLHFNQKVLELGGTLEVQTGITMILGVIIGAQNVLPTLIYLQSLPMRYRLSGYTQRAFASLNATLEPLVYRLGVGTAYAFIKRQLSRLVT